MSFSLEITFLIVKKFLSQTELNFNKIIQNANLLTNENISKTNSIHTVV